MSLILFRLFNRLKYTEMISTTIRFMASTASKLIRPIVFCGPSGAGKSTLLKRLMKEHPKAFAFSVSHTTRSPRPGEENGREYYFVSRDQMTKLIEENQFLEHAQFSGKKH